MPGNDPAAGANEEAGPDRVGTGRERTATRGATSRDLAPAVRFELTTKRLTVARSTTELRRSGDAGPRADAGTAREWAPNRRRATG